MSEEIIAPGRFHWSKVLINDDTWEGRGEILEDRSDPYFWDNLDKENITSIGVKMTERWDFKSKEWTKTNAVFILEHDDIDVKYFHFKRKKHRLGHVGSFIDSEAMVVGVVYNKKGDCEIMYVFPDATSCVVSDNIINMGLNLKQQGIDLGELK